MFSLIFCFVIFVSVWLLYVSEVIYCGCCWIFYQQNDPLTWVKSGCSTNKIIKIWIGINIRMLFIQLFFVWFLWVTIRTYCMHYYFLHWVFYQPNESYLELESDNLPTKCYSFNYCHHVSTNSLRIHHVSQRAYLERKCLFCT